MKVAFTICSNNYFAQASLLGRSFLFHNPDFIFYVGLVDKKNNKIEYETSGMRVIEIADIEPDIYTIALKYNIIELNTAVKPHYFLHFFSVIEADEVFYLDPDIYVYQDLKDLSVLLQTHDILLTPHILQPIPLDNKTPTEADFLNYGLYNLGFLGLKKTNNTLNMLAWWKERTYRFGYKDLAKGLFVDQLWMNLVPLFFNKTKIIDHPGYNMGPWNLHERILMNKNGKFYVNQDHLLYFYHFSNFNPLGSFELHTVLNRFKITERPDLLTIYKDYAEYLDRQNFAELTNIPSHYSVWREEQLLIQKQKAYDKLPTRDKMVRKFKKGLPVSLKNKILSWIQK